MAKRGEVRPYRVEYRWPTMPRPAVRSTERSLDLALDAARRQALTTSGATGEQDCLVRVVDRRQPEQAPRWRRACPSCGELTAWGPTVREWRHAGGAMLCSDATRPERFREDPSEAWTA